MKVLTESKITTISSPDEDLDFPAVNALDRHPKKLAKAASGETITYLLEVAGSGDWLGVINTNARVVKVCVYNPALVFEETYSLGGVDTYAELITGEGQAAYELDVLYDYQTVDHSITLELDTETPGGEVPYVGHILAGVHKAFTYDASKGLQEGLVDYSIIKELSNGATYVKMRDIVRTFSVVLYVERDREFYDFLYGVVREIGQQARLWRVTDLDNNDWVVFARLQAMPVGTHSHTELSTMKFTLIEEL